ncbi:MAG: fused MFS/spermidine synthase [Anaeromyxobacter sp.]
MHLRVGFLFFLSGAAGLAYQVTWSRSLGLVFGASHLAVTTVLTVFMAGQALGGAWLGKQADRAQRPLALYGWLELGVAGSALAFLALLTVYPAFYRALSHVSAHPAYLTIVRTLFASAALLVPTTLMGGTLPVLTRFATESEGGFGRHLSLLYGYNTLGAVAGTLAAGFWLLPTLGVTRTLLVACGASVAVGGVALVLDRAVSRPTSQPAAQAEADRAGDLSLTPRLRRLALIATGVSGFCALGYEVLWTRMLTLVVGTSVYSFAIMLTAFLTGIGLGSHLYSLLPWNRPNVPVGRRHMLVVASAHLGVGLSALAVTTLMRDLPHLTRAIQSALLRGGPSEFGARLTSSGVVALAFMLVPALFMGLAFPASAAVWSAGRRRAGNAAGEALVANTVGAVLGPMICGFVLVYAIGIERSLHVLVALNLGTALLVAAAARNAPRWSLVLGPALAFAVIVVRIASPDWGRAWDRDYFATYTNNARSSATPEQAREMMRDVDVLYYREGVNETVSSIRFFGSAQAFIVNGRPEASTFPVDVALQRSLGHLPALLHPSPRRVFVLGTGTGMTLGSLSIHPEVQRLVLGEIEAGMLGVARTFERWNHRVLDDPKLTVVLNDGRNFLATTDEKFDVISADPIHPWSGGAGYLYTREYFQTVAARLDRGGIACQWLPIYELDDGDLRSVVRTFGQAFRHVLVWLTYYDTVLIGSNDPIRVDEDALRRRLAASPAVQEDLAAIHMGSAIDLLAHFLMGTEGARDFGASGTINTDDNLWLEFDAPAHQGRGDLTGKNVLALAANRESLFPYLDVAAGSVERERARWDERLRIARLTDRAQAAMLLGAPPDEQNRLVAAAASVDPGHGPLKFILEERAFQERGNPKAVGWTEFQTSDGPPLRLTAVRQFLTRDRVLISFVDNARREILAERYLDGRFAELEGDSVRFVEAALGGVQRRLAAQSHGTPSGVSTSEDLRKAMAEIPGPAPR